jgi:hypothetical protein
MSSMVKADLDKSRHEDQIRMFVSFIEFIIKLSQ